MAAEDNLIITISSVDDEHVNVEIWCPALVDHNQASCVDEALTWAKSRLEDEDPFKPYEG